MFVKLPSGDLLNLDKVVYVSTIDTDDFGREYNGKIIQEDTVLLVSTDQGQSVHAMCREDADQFIGKFTRDLDNQGMLI